MIELFHGISFGLGFSIALGPITLILVQTSIEKGKIFALFIAMGVWTADTLLFIISYLGLGTFLFSSSLLPYLSIVGSIVLFSIAIATLRQQPRTQSVTYTAINLKHLSRFYLKGFLLDITNPLVGLSWMTITLYEVNAKSLSTQQAALFFVGIIGTIIGTDVCKILLARKVRGWITPKLLTLTNKIFGLLLMVFAIILLVRAFL